MDLSKHTIVDGKRSPKLTNRTRLVWDVVDTARMWLMEYEERPASTHRTYEKQLAESLIALGKYDSNLIRLAKEARETSQGAKEEAK